MKSIQNLFSNSKFKKNFLVLIFIMIAFLIARIVHGNFRLTDSNEYFATAELLKNGKYFGQTTDIIESINLTKRPFLYPLLILFLGFLNDLVIVLFQTILGIFNLFLVLQIFKNLGGKSYYLITILLFLTPSIFINTHLIMTETIASTVMLLIFRQFQNKLDNRKIVYIQILLCLLFFLKPAFYLFTIVNLLFFIFYFIRTKTFQISVFVPLLMSISYIGYNQHRTGFSHFSSIQNINLIDYNLYLFKMKQEGIDKAELWKKSVYEESEKFKTFEEYSSYLDKTGKSEIKNNLIPYAFFHVKGAIRGMFDPGRFDLITFHEQQDASQGFMQLLNKEDFMSVLKGLLEYKYKIVILILIPIFLTNIFKWFFALSYLWNNRKLWNFRNMYLILICGYSILISGPVNTCRYMVLLQGIVIIIAVLGWENFRQKKAPRLSEAF
ncbi:hypothetical protein [Flavobacterium macacae]|uniref:Glycosyltransferase RgtA/B/C/D-like domain-containing protein n=1 Tax=Flavobacterium macacae TaxID=2488993 RepID=A0A3P3WFY9_9FLAO|nr:hypothetical protein [Flavobacterium macacae]RRJ93594.1 hypothetical protein EG849_01810 [Flavobacterium macacae]